jgi:histidyl-tRNA synthetase
VSFLQRYADSLDADSQRRLQSNPLRVLDSKSPQTQALLAEAPGILEFLDDESRAHLDGLQQGLSDLGIPYKLNQRLVRGLDYYTRGVFEWTTTQLGAQGTVCAGGRYDGLVEQLGGSKTSAVGWASGVERLILLLDAQQAELPDHAAQIYFCWLGEAAQRAALKLAEELRDRLPGLRMVLHAGGGKLQAQLKRADRSGASLALILGENEAAESRIQVKSLRSEASQQSIVGWPELAGTLAGLLNLNENKP